MTRAEITLDPKDLSEWERKTLMAVAYSDVIWRETGWRGRGEFWSSPLVMFIPKLIEQKFIAPVGSGSLKALALTHDGKVIMDRIEA